MPENRVKLPPSKTRRITHEEFANACKAVGEIVTAAVL